MSELSKLLTATRPRFKSGVAVIIKLYETDLKLFIGDFNPTMLVKSEDLQLLRSQ